MNKNSKSVKHAKAVLKYWDKPFCTCLLKYIDELEKKAYKCEYYQEHADIFYNELTALREDSAIDKYIIEKQQKEIEKLKSKKYIFNAKTQEIKEVPIDDNYISKDKIEAKIEKIKEDEKFYRERDRMYEFNGKINILKELLGE